MHSAEPITLRSVRAGSTATTFLITDIVGSTAIVERMGDRAWLELLRRHNRLVRREVERHRGFEVKSVGDGFIIAFARPALGLRCAVAVAHALAVHNREHPDDELEVRMGLHVGEALEDDADLFGREVVLAVRVSALAMPGEILVSDAFREAVAGAAVVQFDAGHEVTLKGLRGTHRVFRALWQQSSPREGAFDSSPEQPLLERQDDLGRLNALLAAASVGQGGVALVSGPAGIGKTALVERFVAEASAGAVAVLAARAEPLDREGSFGVVRRLMQPTLARLPADERARLLGDADGPAAALLGFAGEGPLTGDAETVRYATLTGLTRVARNLAGAGPVIIVVDDVQWADAGSLAWFTHLAARLGETRVLLVLVRRSEPAEADAAFAEIAAGSATHKIEPLALSSTAVEALIRSHLGEPAPAFTAACQEATGGNPFYLRSLLHALAGEGIAPDQHGAGQVARVRPPAVRQMVAERLSRLPDTPRRLAVACAALGNEADLELAAELLAVPVGEAVLAADSLCAAGILRARRPLMFSHPIVGATVLSGADAESGDLHRTAADVLGRAGKAPLIIASHLLLAAPAGDQGTVRTLMLAAEQAMSDGTPTVAVRLLTRALKEPPSPAAAWDVRLALGRAQLAAADYATARATLEEAAEQADNPVGVGQAELSLASAVTHLVWSEDPESRWEEIGTRTVSRLERAIGGLSEGDRELRFQLESARLKLESRALSMFSLAFAKQDDERLTALAAEATGGTVGEQEILGEYAAESAVQARLPSAEVIATARKALAGGRLAAELATGALSDSAFEALIICDACDEAERWLRHAAEVAAIRGTPASARLVALLRGVCAVFEDRLDVAREHLAEVAALSAEAPPEEYIESVARGARVAVELAADDLAAADTCARSIAHERLRHHARGLVFAARGDHARAVVEFGAAQAILDGRRIWRTGHPLRPVRPDLSLSLLATGRREDAIRIAAAELEVAERVEIPSCLAEARRALGLARGGSDGIALLKLAVEAADRSPAPQLRSRARRGLAELLQAEGETAGARVQLEGALEIADARELVRERRLAGEALGAL